MSTPNAVVLTPARSSDLPAFAALLRGFGLPEEGLEPLLPTTTLARQGGAVVGSAALERYEQDGLLRSVAVASSCQGTGLGRRLTEAILDQAAAEGVQDVYLLTTTAEAFFTHLGFACVAREAVAPAVQASDEFSTLCPSTAVVMKKTCLHTSHE